MINDIITAISIAIDRQFNSKSDKYEIHTEEIKQGLVEPCFFIQCINPKTRLFCGKRYFTTKQFCIQYFPSTVKKNAECNEVLEILDDCLEYITVNGDLMRGKDTSSNVSGGVLSYFINYDCFIYKQSNEDAFMEQIEIREEIRS